MFFHQPHIEPVVACGHRRVRRKDNLPGNSWCGLLKTEALIFHAVANGFENCERAMSFVQVQNARSDSHRFQGAETPDAKQQLLADADAPVAAIQTRRELPILRSVTLYIRVQKKEIAPSYPGAPDLCCYGSTAGINLHDHRGAVYSDGRFQRQLVDIVLQIFFVLPSILVEALPEIALAVKQSNTHQWNAQIGGALNMIACQHA